MGSRSFFRHAVFTACSTLLLIAIGGLVTSHGAGMAVPDWPNSYGYNMFAFPVSSWVGGILYEHTHRLWASAVGFFFLTQALWAHGRAARCWLRWGGAVVLLLGLAASWSQGLKRDNVVFLCGVGAVALAAGYWLPFPSPQSQRLRRFSLAGLILVLGQGLLGGLRVVLYKDQIGVVHATLAQALLGLQACLAVEAWRQLQPRRALDLFEGSAPGWRRWVPIVAVAVFLQLVLGAGMRHQHAGLAVPDFPLAYGGLWPSTHPEALVRANATRIDSRDFHPITAGQIQLHMAHRVGAVVVFSLLIALWLRVRRAVESGQWPRRLTGLWLAGGVAQFTLGAFTVWTNKAADVATLHVVTGASLLVIGAVFTFLLYAPPVPQQSPALRPSGSEPEGPCSNRSQVGTRG